MTESQTTARQARLYDVLQIHPVKEMTDNRVGAQKMHLESRRSRGGMFET